MSEQTKQRVRDVTSGVESKYGLEDGLLFRMAGTESNYTADAVSPKNARGWFQFMPATAKSYGVNDPTDLIQSAEGAGRYMSDNMKKYGGNLNEALADYNGGPDAVAALRAGKPWAETRGYINKITGKQKTPADYPPLSSQFTTGSAATTALGPDAAELAARGPKPRSLARSIGDLPGDIADGIRLDNSVYNYLQTTGTNYYGPPQELTEEGHKELTEGIPPDHWDYMLQGRNDIERSRRKNRVIESMGTEQRLSEHGWTGVTGRLIGGLADIPTLIGFIPVVGGAGVMTSAGRIANAVRMGAVMGSTNAAFEAATYQNRPLGTTHDIYTAAAMGVGMGGLIGGLSNPARFALHAENQQLQALGIREANAGHLAEIEASGGTATPAYKNFLLGLEAQKTAAMRDVNAGIRDWSLRDLKDPSGFPTQGSAGAVMPEPLQVPSHSNRVEALSNMGIENPHAAPVEVPGTSPTKLPGESTVPAAQKFSERSLTGVAKDSADASGNALQERLKAAPRESSDMSPATFDEMLAFRAQKYGDTQHIVSARAAASEAFGAESAAGLERSGRVKFIPSQADLPKSLQHKDGVNAFYDPVTDTTYLLADRLNKGNIRGIMLHDVGVHQGLERMVGTQMYDRMIATVQRLADEGDVGAARAIERAERSPTSAFLKPEERLAYYIEHLAGKEAPVTRSLLSAVKGYLAKRFGFDMKLTAADLLDIVESSLHGVAKKEFGSYNGDMTHVWHGSAVREIDKLSTKFVGTGEGNINQGWGIYTTSSKFIGNWYRLKESMARGIKGDDGGLYQLKVHDASPEQFIRWEAPTQSGYVREALEGSGIETSGKTGREIYFDLMGKAEGETPLARAKAVSELLDSIGIKGNVYGAGGFRKDAVKSDNYVFFNDRHLDVSARYSVGDVPGMAPGEKAPYVSTVGDADAAKAATEADVSQVFGWGLGMEDRLGGASSPALVRNFSAKLMGTTKGYKDHSVVKANAWDMTNALADSWALKLRKDAYPAFEEWFKESGRGRAEKGKAFDEFGEKISDYVRGVDGEYPKQVQKAGEAVRAIANEAREHINNPGKFNGGKKLGLTETLIKDPETGVESIVGTLEHNPNYIPRSHDVTKWNSAVNQFGREAVEGWWARAYQSARTEITDEAAAKWSKWYVKTVEDARMDRSQDLMGDLLQGTDREALKQSLVLNGGYSEAEAMFIIKDMIPSRSSDSGALQANFKHRSSINEKYTETLQTADGQSIKMGLNDFTNSNALTSMEIYLRRTAGNVALSEHLGIHKVGDISKAIHAATENKFGSSERASADVARNRGDLKFAIDRIQGIPQEEFTGLNKALEMWRNFNVIRLMGGTVWNQAAEMSQIVGSMGWRAVLAAIPELRSLSRDMATGKAPHDILEHLENTIGGAGSEFIKRMDFKLSDDWVRNKGDTAWNRRLDAMDTKLKQVAKGTLDYTGMTPLMIQQKRVHAVALVNHFVNDATGKAKSTFLTADRLAWMGMDKEAFDAVQASLKKYTSPTKGEYGQTFKLDFENWVKESPDTHAKFMEAIHRETRRVIQENDLASMIPIMGTTLGQTVFQFMNFSMHGWNKSLMFAANHRDFSTLSTVMHGGLFSALAYMGRSMVSSVGMTDEQKTKFMTERMSTKQIVANSMGKIAQASLLPNLYDSTLGNLTGTMFSGMRTTSDISSIASNPTLSAINGVLSLGKIGKNAISGESQTTQHDIKQWGKLLPLNNVAPISTLLNSLANDYPISAKQQ